jgi:hypothetical protein
MIADVGQLRGLSELNHDDGQEPRTDLHGADSWPLFFRFVYGPVRLRAAGDLLTS